MSDADHVPTRPHTGRPNRHFLRQQRLRSQSAQWFSEMRRQVDNPPVEIPKPIQTTFEEEERKKLTTESRHSDGGAHVSSDGIPDPHLLGVAPSSSFPK